MVLFGAYAGVFFFGVVMIYSRSPFDGLMFEPIGRCHDHEILSILGLFGHVTRTINYSRERMQAVSTVRSIDDRDRFSDRFSQTGRLAQEFSRHFCAFLMCARLLWFCFQCFFGTASLSCRRRLQRRRQTQLQRCFRMEAKGTKTAGVGSSVARSDRSVPQARGCDDIHPGVLNATPVCSSCAAVHVCVE